MPTAIQDLLDILDLEQLEHNLYRGRSINPGWQRVFGGQVIAQALVAAQRTVPTDRFVHSLHAYFMLPGDPDAPIIYQVERVRDGGSFATRRVRAIQHGKDIFTFAASFQLDEVGLEHAAPMPLGVPSPDGLMNQRDIVARFPDKVSPTFKRVWERDRAVEMRPVSLDPYVNLDRRRLPPERQIWMRPAGTVPDDRTLCAALLAYMSDMAFLSVTMLPHGRVIFDADIQAASIDHAMWFHRPIRFDDWLLYSQDTPFAGGGRGLARGQVYASDGTLLASMAQEGLIRVREEPHS